MKNIIPPILVSAFAILLLFGFALTAQAGNDLGKAAEARESATKQAEQNREAAEQKREAAEQKKERSKEHRDRSGKEMEKGPHHGEHHKQHHGESYHKDKKDEPYKSGKGEKKGHRHMPEQEDKY